MADKRTILSDYYEQIEKYKGLAEATLKELNECRAEMMQMKAEIMNRINDGQYLWDSKRIVISAPEIIIGNVTKNGELKDGGKVIIMGNEVNLNGAGPAGSIHMKAPSILQKAVNPGNDGKADIVEPISSIKSVARGIQVATQSPQTVEGRGATFIPTGVFTGVSIVSDSGVQISATQSHDKKKSAIENYKKSLEEMKKDCKPLLKGRMETMMILKTGVEKDAGISKDLSKLEDLTKTNILALDELNSKGEDAISSFLHAAYDAIYCISYDAECNRKIACLDKELEELNKVDDDKFKKNSTKTYLRMESENVYLLSMDGEGEVRTNPEAGILIRGNRVDIGSQTKGAQLTPEEAKGHVNVVSRNISLSTADLIDPVFEKGELKSCKSPAVGTVNIISKTVNVNAMDIEQTDKDKFKETKLTEKSEVNIRAEKVKVKTINEEGKSVGKFSVNSQKISLKSTDIKEYKPDFELDKQGNIIQKEMHSDKVAADSQMLLMSQTINIGRKKKDMISKNVRIASDDSSVVCSNKLTNITVGEDGAFDAGVSVSNKDVHLAADGDTKISGNKVNVEGETTFNSKVTGTDIECKNVTASSAIKAPNITDGVMVANPAGSKSKPDGDKPNDVDL